VSHTVGRVTSKRLALVFVGALSSACVTTSAGGPSTVAHRELELVSAPGEVRHRVEKGQTLYRIAKTYGLTVDELMRANDLDDPRELKVGERLRIPGARAVKTSVVTADAPEPTPPVRAASADKPQPKVLAKVGSANGPLAWPLRGVLYARFGRKGAEAHDGIDLAAPAGTPVKTAGPGTTLYAGEQRGYGLIVVIEHAGGLVSLYAHNRDVRVKTGQVVREGQVVATVGDSGKTSGPHLHFEVRRDGVPVDPLLFLGPVPPPAAPPGGAPVSAER
jgi:lipoprotein NlpD